MRALVVFHDHGCHVLSRFLKSGFRHVFAAVLAGDFWISIDSRAGVPVVEVIAPRGFDLAKFYRDQGFAVVETSQCTVPPRAPLLIANCVGCVKALLCIRARAITPYGLYKHLRANP